MRTSTIGIILLTVMVATKYFVSLDTMHAEDGSFKNGIVVDYTSAFENLRENKSVFPINNLLAFNSSTHITTNADKLLLSTQSSDFNKTSSNFNTKKIEQNNSEEPLPMEYSNSLVVYDFSNPDNNLVSSNFDDIDIEDDIPLDNGNTIINGLMLIMPRR